MGCGMWDVLGGVLEEGYDDERECAGTRSVGAALISRIVSL